MGFFKRRKGGERPEESSASERPYTRTGPLTEDEVDSWLKSADTRGASKGPRPKPDPLSAHRPGTSLADHPIWDEVEKFCVWYSKYGNAQQGVTMKRSVGELRKVLTAHEFDYMFDLKRFTEESR